MIKDELITEVSNVIELSIETITKAITGRDLSNLEIMWICMESIARCSTSKDYRDKEQLLYFTEVMIQATIETTDHYLIPEDQHDEYRKRSRSWEELVKNV